MLTRRTPMRRSPMRSSVRPTVPAKIREELTVRSGGWCEARLPGCTGQATDVCHRIARKAGGRPLGDDARLSNLWHGCRTCHSWATDNPTEAYDLGLALQEWRELTEEPMAYQNAGWVVLDDDGTLWPADGPHCDAA